MESPGNCYLGFFRWWVKEGGGCANVPSTLVGNRLRLDATLL